MSSEDVTMGKPAPDGYLLAARRLRTPISDCVVVEDSVAGGQAGLAAGARHVLGVRPRALTVVTDLSGVTWTGSPLRHPAGGLLRHPWRFSHCVMKASFTTL